MCLSARCHVPCVLVGPCRPKWMRMVDNVYSGNPQESNNQNKLIHYCLHQPDKLDRIAKYLYKRLSQDVNRRYDLNMFIAIECINKLIQACHGQRLVLAQVFLRMVHLLLQTNRVDLQILAAKSFVEFSQIEDDVPNYLKEYNDLIDHFCSMAHASSPNIRERNKVRMAGIFGIQGVVRKTVGDQLHLDVVHGSNMNKIIPSLLLNIFEKPELDPGTEDQEDPSQEAVFVFKDIASRASHSNIRPVVTSILTHLDNHKLWDPPDFPLLIFQYLLDSIENTQTAHGLVKQLVAHLSTHESDFTLPERTCMVQVIGLTVISLAKGAIGPDVFHNFNALLQILRASIDKTSQEAENLTDARSQTSSEERQFQEAIINTIAEFAKNLPDTQKIEILKFILNFEPMAKYHPENGVRPRPLIMVLLQTMLTVATQYRTVAISNALNSDFLNLLLRGVAVDRDPAIRIIVQKILHTLLDRHENTDRLLNVQVYTDQPLEAYFVWEEPSRQDILFMKKTGVLLTENIYHQLLDPTNKVDCLEHLFCTVGLVALELGADQVIAELFRLILAVQKKIVDEPPTLPIPHRCALHALLAGAMSLIVQLVNLLDLRTHVDEVISVRKNTAPYLLPSLAFNRTNTTESYPVELELREDLQFSADRISEALSAAGYDVSTLNAPYHPVYTRLYEQSGMHDPLMGIEHRDHITLHSATGPNFLDTPYTRNASRPGSGFVDITRLSGRGLSDECGYGLQNGVYDPSTGQEPARSESSYSLTDSLYSVADSAKMTDDLLSFKNMRKIVTEINDGYRKRAELDNTRLLNRFSSADVHDVFAPQVEKSRTLRMRLAEIFDEISFDSHPTAEANIGGGPRKFASTKDSQTDLDQAGNTVTPDLDTGGAPRSVQPSCGQTRKVKRTTGAAPLVEDRDYRSLFMS